MKDVLVDTSVWVDHFRRRNETLIDLLAFDRVLVHPLVVGEMACGTPPRRGRTLSDLGGLKPARQASIREVIEFIDRERLFGLGCGLVDMTLLASTLMTPQAELWTLDQRLRGLAERFGVMHGALLH
jgi:predicted nucleic acid-binding protein